MSNNDIEVGVGWLGCLITVITFLLIVWIVSNLTLLDQWLKGLFS